MQILERNFLRLCLGLVLALSLPTYSSDIRADLRIDFPAHHNFVGDIPWLPAEIFATVEEDLKAKGLNIVGADYKRPWGVVAEIWQHTDPLHPSDEDDIVRVQDDFKRN